MKHYEIRLTQDLNAIRERVVAVGHAVGKALQEAMRGLNSFDKERLNRVMLHDHPINRETRAIDQLCHAFVARHLPAAGHLRFVSSVLRLNIALERVGDYAVTLGRVGVLLPQAIPTASLEAIHEIGERAIRMLSLAIQAFEEGDVELARDTILIAKKIDVIHTRAFSSVMEDGEDRSLREVVSVLTILSHLERVSDQAKNICEEAIFVKTGQTKQPKVYKVLFIDETNSLVSPLAAALARKAFPESGRYTSAGWAPSGALHPALDRIADRLSLDITSTTPLGLDTVADQTSQYNVIVLIHPEKVGELPDIPFHTILLRWALGSPPSGDEQPFDARMDEIARDLSTNIQDLMVTLRGEHAN